MRPHSAALNPPRIPSRARDFHARGSALGILLVAAATLGGCGFSLLGHRIGFPARPSEPHRGGLAGKIDETREQSALAPNEPYWPCRLGQLYLAADSAQQAEVALKSSLARDRFYAPALSLLSKLYFESGRHEEAIKMLESARSDKAGLPGGFPPALLAGLALHYDAIGRPDLAGATMAAVPGADRKDAGSAGVYLTLRGEAPDSAADLASAVLRENPRSAVGQNNFGITKLRAGDAKSARRAFLEAIEIDPGLAGPYYNLAILEKFYLFDDEAAARWFKLYGERSSDDPDSLRGLLGKRVSKELAEQRNER